VAALKSNLESFKGKNHKYYGLCVVTISKNEFVRENQKIIYPDPFVVYNQGTMQIETCITQ
jgi:hypothetical protein